MTPAKITKKDVKEVKLGLKVLMSDETMTWFIQQVITTTAIEVIDRDPSDHDDNRAIADLCIELLSKVDINREVAKIIRKNLK